MYGDSCVKIQTTDISIIGPKPNFHDVDRFNNAVRLDSVIKIGYLPVASSSASHRL